MIILYGFIFVRSQTPVSGILKIPTAHIPNIDTNPKSQIQIRRDKWGIAHIQGVEKNHLWFGLGWVHAQDRLWQMEIARLGAIGRLSSLFGKKMLPADRFFLTLSLQKWAQKSYEALPKQSKTMLSFYIAGINSYLKTYPDRLPPEFQLYNHKPKPFTVLHTMAMIYFYQWQMDNPLRLELIIAYLNEKINQKQKDHGLLQNILDQIQTPIETYPLTESNNNNENIVFHSKDNGLLIAENSAFQQAELAVSIQTEIKRIPNKWYAAHLGNANMQISGITIPGIPIFYFGKNGHLSWAMTKGDFYYRGQKRKKLNLIPLKKYQQNPSPQIVIHQEKLFIDENTHIPLFVENTKLGPVITSAFNFLPEFIKLRKKYILQWSGLQINEDIALFQQISEAKNLSQWCQTMTSRQYNQPAAFLAMDFRGKTSMFTNHNKFIPEKSNASNNPQPAHLCTKNRTLFSKSLTITDPQSIQDMPILLQIIPGPQFPNPASNILHKTNPSFPLNEQLNKIWTKKIQNNENKDKFVRYALWDTNAFGYEKMTIDIILQAVARFQKKENKQKTDNPQYDYLALYSGKHKNMVIAVLEQLENWNNNYSHDSIAAGILQRFKLAFLRNVFYDKLGELLTDELLKLETHTDQIFLGLLRLGLNNPQCACFDQSRTSKKIEDFWFIVRLSFYDTLFYWHEQKGKAVRNWKWENIHYIAPDHPLATGFLGKILFHISKIKESGNQNTLWNMTHNPLHKNSITKGPSLVLRFFPGDRPAKMMMLFGQSGINASSHYDDLAKNWQRRNFVSLPSSSSKNKTLILRFDQ